VKKPRGRPFEPGNKVGRGRPKGSRNRIVGEAKAILDEYSPHLMRKVVAMAMEGNTQALKLCIERAVPAPRDVGTAINLPQIRSAGDIVTAAQKVTRGVGKGTLSPSAAEKVMNVLESHSRVIESFETEKRVEKLEADMAAVRKPHSHDQDF
jgi:hypothetical protein